MVALTQWALLAAVLVSWMPGTAIASPTAAPDLDRRAPKSQAPNPFESRFLRPSRVVELSSAIDSKKNKGVFIQMYINTETLTALAPLSSQYQVQANIKFLNEQSNLKKFPLQLQFRGLDDPIEVLYQTGTGNPTPYPTVINGPLPTLREALWCDGVIGKDCVFQFQILWATSDHPGEYQIALWKSQSTNTSKAPTYYYVKKVSSTGQSTSVNNWAGNFAVLTLTGFPNDSEKVDATLDVIPGAFSDVRLSYVS
ncbi:hypothetical protein DRE_04608 [Drechslerella stenobrocha 248]|uniref:Ubiquitin 3 binding protein But2 C-terminal domain-containing protein n=1 Tax=Drechslerella stenobrocha 248 TaxID=1043628 RepID=W7IAY4_9PEZI|nr:hypothetical protein DRE_04608 [Drechslerella stenobrocha 248]